MTRLLRFESRRRRPTGCDRSRLHRIPGVAVTNSTSCLHMSSELAKYLGEGT